jgi:hypothetical protein
MLFTTAGSTAVDGTGTAPFEGTETRTDDSPQLVCMTPFDGGSLGGLASFRETASEGSETGVAETVSMAVSSSSSSASASLSSWARISAL